VGRALEWAWNNFFFDQSIRVTNLILLKQTGAASWFLLSILHPRAKKLFNRPSIIEIGPFIIELYPKKSIFSELEMAHNMHQISCFQEFATQPLKAL